MKVILQNNNPSKIEIQISGKWILAGEHSVLRGGEALVFPLKSRYLQLVYNSHPSGLNSEISSELNSALNIKFRNKVNQNLEDIVRTVLNRIFNKLNIQPRSFKGQLEFDSHILFGAGMGASATLCVALTELFHKLNYINENQKYEFARDLENIFHGESSGVDVAVTLYNQALVFSRNSKKTTFLQSPLLSHFEPYLYLSHTGAFGITKECVEQVKKMHEHNNAFATQIDAQMQDAVLQFKNLLSLNEFNEESWIQAMQKAHQCFYDWELVNETVVAHENLLKRSGALAVKLTGSGNGGFMLSLWRHPITEELSQKLQTEFIPCFAQKI